MKQKFLIKFYLYIGLAMGVVTHEAYACTQQLYAYNEIHDQDVQHVLVQLREIYHQIDKLQPQNSHPDIIAKVIIIFIEMYQKIVEATVAYYLLPNNQVQHNLHDIIIKIIADDTIKLISFLCQELVNFIFDHQLSWQEKVGYSAWIVSMICIIKLGIEKLPTNMNPSDGKTSNFVQKDIAKQV